MKFLCELVNIETGEVYKTEEMSRYAKKNRNNKLAFQGSPWRWRIIGDEQTEMFGNG